MTPSTSERNVTGCLELLPDAFPAAVGSIPSSASSQSTPPCLKLFTRTLHCAHHLLPDDFLFAFVSFSGAEVLVSLTQTHVISVYHTVECRLCRVSSVTVVT